MSVCKVPNRIGKTLYVGINFVNGAQLQGPSPFFNTRTDALSVNVSIKNVFSELAHIHVHSDWAASNRLAKLLRGVASV